MEPARLLATDLACRRGERLLFRGLSFELNAGEALQVVGPNGTGKSSLIRILAGLLRPAAGTVEKNRQTALLDERLPLDAVIEGPAILEQMDATTVVNPGDRADCDPHGNIIITVGMLQ